MSLFASTEAWHVTCSTNERPGSKVNVRCKFTRCKPRHVGHNSVSHSYLCNIQSKFTDQVYISYTIVYIDLVWLFLRSPFYSGCNFGEGRVMCGYNKFLETQSRREEYREEGGKKGEVGGGGRLMHGL